MRNMADVKVALDELKEGSDSGKVDSPSPAHPVAPLPRRYLLPALAVALVAAGAVWWVSQQSNFACRHT